MRSGAQSDGQSNYPEYDRYHNTNYEPRPESPSSELASYGAAMAPRPLPPVTSQQVDPTLIEERRYRQALYMAVETAFEAQARATILMEQWKAADGDDETKTQQSRMREAIVQGSEVHLTEKAEGRGRPGFSEQVTIRRDQSYFGRSASGWDS